MFKRLKLLLNKIPTITVDRFKFIVVMTIILVLIENIPSFINRFNVNEYNNYTTWYNIYSLTIESLMASALTLAVLFLVSCNKYLLKLVVVLFLCISSIFIYILVSYKVIINEVLFVSLMQANDGETQEMITWVPVAIFIFLGALPSLFIIFCVKIKSNINSIKDCFYGYFWESLLKKIVIFICIPIIVMLLLVLFGNRALFFNTYNVKTSLSGYMPLNYIGGYYQYITKLSRDVKIAKNIKELSSKYKFSFNSALKEEPLTVVLVIGESSRAKSQAYNGYYRDTNKYTKNINGLVYLKDVKSCATYTIGSVPCMLSHLTRKEFSLPTRETGLISVFKDLGFKTYWISTQTAYSSGLNAIFRSATEASEFYFINSVRPYVPSGGQVYDDITATTLVKEAIDSPHKQKLIVFQLFSSHIKYKERFPEEFMIYTPSCKLNSSNCGDIALQNDYDNATVYNDYVLSLVINQLKDKNALLIYMSDHGESLPTDKSGFLFHNATYNIAPPEQTHVAALMWLSDGMQKLLPGAIDNVRKYANLHISHDYIFSTLLGCIGVKSQVINNNLNLCLPNGLPNAKSGKYY